MKVLLKEAAARLERLAPLAITAIGFCCVLGLGIIDYYTPGPMSFVVFYMLVVVLGGYRAGNGPGLFISTVVMITIVTAHWGLGRATPQTGWLALWNGSTRFISFIVAGWLTAEGRRLNRHLSALVEERTAQWKAELEQHKTTSARLKEAHERFEQVVSNITEVFWLTNGPKNEVAYISPGYERVWGRKCAELYREPKSWMAGVHPADRD